MSRHPAQWQPTEPNERLLLPLVKGTEPTFSAYDLIDAYVPMHWNPRWEDTGRPLLRQWMLAVFPLIGSVGHFEAHMRASSRIFHFGELTGLSLDAETLLSDRTINAFLVDGLGNVTSATRMAYRTSLRNLAKVTLKRPPRWRPDPKWSKEAIAAPYLPDEMASLWALVRTQRTVRLRRYMAGWMGLAVGAGLRNTETRYITGSHFSAHQGVLLVHVPGPRARTVPLRRDVVRHLEPLIEQFPDEVLCGPFTPQQREPMTISRNRLEIPAWAPAVSTERFRSTWIVNLLDDNVPIQRVLEYAGQTSFRFDTTVKYLSDRKEKADADLRRAAGYAS